MADETNPAGVHGAVRWERAADGIVTVVLDDSESRTNMITPRHVAGMNAMLTYLEENRGRIRGVLVTSAKESFFSGPEFEPEGTPSGDGGTYEHVVEVREQLRRLERFDRPVAAALTGSALGGGLEIALACHHRVGLDASEVRWALAEATTGILPAGGGTVRAARMFGMATAVREVVGAGLAYAPRMALARGLVDGLAPTPKAVRASARRWIVESGPDGGGQRWERPDYRVSGGVPGEPGFEAELAAVRAEIESRPGRRDAEAVRAVVDVAVAALDGPLAAAFEVETAAFLRLVALPATRELGLVFAGLKRIRDRIARVSGPPQPIGPTARTFAFDRRSPLVDVFLPGCPDRIVDITLDADATEELIGRVSAAAAPLGVPIVRRRVAGATTSDRLDRAILDALEVHGVA